MTWVVTMVEDPWKSITPPASAAAISALRVDAQIPWEFFWARDVDRKYLLVLKYKAGSSPETKLPKLKGVELTVSGGENGSDRAMVFRLLESTQRDIFLRLCRDIISSCTGAGSEKDAVALALARTWRWHHLLRGGSDGRLSLEEQKGLVGELLLLERYLLPRFPPLEAITAWRGPLGAPKDFEVGRTCIEVKARRGSASPFVIINSEFQLDSSGSDNLFLSVVELDRSPSGDEAAFTLPDVASRVREQIVSDDKRALDLFETLLSASGFSWEDDYSDCLWIDGAETLYEVTEGFPCLVGSLMPSGVSAVKYSLSLHACEPFRVEATRLITILDIPDHAD